MQRWLLYGSESVAGGCLASMAQGGHFQNAKNRSWREDRLCFPSQAIVTCELRPAPYPKSLLVHVLATIDRQGRTSHEIAFVGGKEDHSASDVAGLAEPADGDARDDLLQHFRRHAANHLGVDVPGSDCINGDAKARALLRQGLGEAVNA